MLECYLGRNKVIPGRKKNRKKKNEDPRNGKYVGKYKKMFSLHIYISLNDNCLKQE